MTQIKFTNILKTGLILILVSCVKVPANTDLPSNPKPGGGATCTPYKRGVAFSTNTDCGTWNNNIVNLKANWYYTWGLNTCADPNAPLNVEFVPMFWGHATVTQANVNIVNSLYKQGKIFYVLGFNEPDLADQSNMTVEQALEDWKFLSTKLDQGITLVSPAVAWPGAQWFKDFMAGVQQQGLRLDHIALHIYMGQSPSTYTTQVSDIYSLYGKKIWITEFAPRDDNAVSGQPSSNHFSAQWILDNFMTPLLPQLESTEAVYRYSWLAVLPPGQICGHQFLLTVMGTSQFLENIIKRSTQIILLLYQDNDINILLPQTIKKEDAKCILPDT